MLDRTAGPTPKQREREFVATVGCRIRMARESARLSQEALGAALGVSFQQVQKYEKGVNRISPGFLAIVAEVTRRDIAWFFEAPPTDEIADHVLLVDGGLFLREDRSVTEYVDEAQRFTRAIAQKHALSGDSFTCFPASDYADDRYRSRASLIAELVRIRTGGAGHG